VIRPIQASLRGLAGSAGRRRLFHGGLLAAALSVSGGVQAGNGPYINGSGIKSQGMGGLSLVVAEDSYMLSANPAGASVLGQRQDYGLDFETAHPDVTVRGNLLGPDETRGSSLHGFFIPQIGFARPVSERLAVGATAFFSGFGTDYEPSPYRRFLGAGRSGVQLVQVGGSFALAWMAAPRQSLGLALNLSYQGVEVTGVQSFSLLLPSENPRRFSNQGVDAAYGVGFTLGWLGRITPQLVGAFGYRSKTWAQRFKEYEGLLPDQGRVEFPQNVGLGLRWEFLPDAFIGYEFQRVFFSSETATCNGFNGMILTGPALGSDDGPGFNWRTQNVHRLGLGWRCTDSLTLRAGVTESDAIVRPSQTLLGAFAPALTTRHYTLGATWELGPRWEVTGYWMHGSRVRVAGEGSIPALAGGGEVDLAHRTSGIDRKSVV
jgi:long-chain fatty acid transport protein